MPLSRGDKEYSIPVKGLNTEASPLYFPPEFVRDINNLELGFDPLRFKARKGHTNSSISDSGSQTLTTSTGGVAVTTFLWTAAAGDQDSNFLCLQLGRRLLFVDANSTDATTVDLSVYLDLDDVKSGTTKGTLAIATTTPLSYTIVKGRLLVTSEAIEPTLIEYDLAGNSVSFTQLTLKVRDIIGLESGIDVDFRPTVIGDFPVGSTASATFAALSEEHEYNLYNQGWYKHRRLTAGSGVESEPIAEFFTINAVYPSNADIVHIGMIDSSGDLIFDAELLKDQTFGSSPSARGRYVLDAFDLDRDDARLNKDTSGANTGGGLGPPKDGGPIGGLPV